MTIEPSPDAGTSAVGGSPAAAQSSSGEQLTLVRSRVRPVSAAPEPPAVHRPVARVVLEVGLAHLDRPFDYEVAESQSVAAAPGARVRVRLAGREVTGFVVERLDSSPHTPAAGLQRLRTVVSAEPVLTPEVLALCRAVADRCAGTLADVLRLAVPPRLAREERRDPQAAMPPPESPDPRVWGDYDSGPEFVAALCAGHHPRAVWAALPAHNATDATDTTDATGATDARPGAVWARLIAVAVQATLSGGRGALVVAPDACAVRQLDVALRAALGPGAHVVLTADAGPGARYRRFLAVRRGEVRCVVGTRAAAFAPVHDLGLVVCWDDGDDSLAEQRAPYCHAREVLLLRSPDCAVLLGGHTVTPEASRLVATGWARRIGASRELVRVATPRVRAGSDTADSDPLRSDVRVPQAAWAALRSGLTRGPVLVQVPRAGYLPALSCQRCRFAASCEACSGPLQLTSATGDPACRWCGRHVPGWTCPRCGGAAVRARTTGVRRTAEELGRTFAGVPVLQSSGDALLGDIDDTPAIVVATPGGEPVAASGYAATVLLDGWALLGRADLRAGQETLRRWSAALALTRPAREGGEVVVCADSTSTAVQALIRADAFGAGARELAERTEAALPPSVRLAVLSGADTDVRALLADVELPGSARVLDPAPVSADVTRALVRVPVEHGQALARALQVAQARRSASRSGATVRIAFDPVELD